MDEVRRDDLPLPVTQVAPAPWRNAKALGYEAGARAFHLIDARI
jgi:hypothetical protein